MQGSGHTATNPYFKYIRFHKLELQFASLPIAGDRRVVGLGLVALAIARNMFTSISEDQRPYSRKDERLERTEKSVRAQVVLLAKALRSLETEKAANVADHFDATVNARVFSVHELVDKVTDTARRAYADQAGAPARLFDEMATTAILADRSHYAEDVTFAGVHAVMECWFELALALGAGMIHQSVPQRTGTLIVLRDVYEFFLGHIRILECLSMTDYHQLRIALKGASGAQSVAANRLRRFLSGLTAFDASPDTIADLYEDPQSDVDTYAYYEHLGDLEAAIAIFYLCHYQLALRVNGLEGKGSLEHGMLALASTFIDPFSPTLAAARYNLIQRTDVKHAALSSTLLK